MGIFFAVTAQIEPVALVNEADGQQRTQQSMQMLRVKAMQFEKGVVRDGGRGRNRTYNLSVKSRMLCQLSYASILGGKNCAAGFQAQPEQDVASIALERI